MAERVMSAAGLVFKGSGFYITDYGKDGKKDQKAAPAPAAAKTPDAAPSQAKSETAPAPAESKPATTTKKPE